MTKINRNRFHRRWLSLWNSLSYLSTFLADEKSNAFVSAWLPSTWHWTQSPAGSATRFGLPDGPHGWSHTAVLMQFPVLQFRFSFIWKAIERLIRTSKVCGVIQLRDLPQPVRPPKQSCHLRRLQQYASRLHLCIFQCEWTDVMEVKFSQFPDKAEVSSQHSGPWHSPALCSIYTHNTSLVHLQWHKSEKTSNNSQILLTRY